MVANEEAEVVWEMRLKPFGAVAYLDEDADGDGEPFTLDLRRPGQWFDAETDLYYNWFRYYDPESGRYLSCVDDGIWRVYVLEEGRDFFRSLGRDNTASRFQAAMSHELGRYYIYASNNPVTYSDRGDIRVGKGLVDGLIDFLSEFVLHEKSTEAADEAASAADIAIYVLGRLCYLECMQFCFPKKGAPGTFHEVAYECEQRCVRKCHWPNFTNIY